MFNHARGLWGYTGTAADGEPLTIQATGIGAASAAVVAGELCDLGLRSFVRVGTALSRDGAAYAPGDVVAVTRASRGDGVSQALGGRGTVLPDDAMTGRLHRALGLAAAVHSTDLPAAGSLDIDLDVADLQTAALLQVAHTRGLAAAAALVVVGVAGRHLDDALDDDALLAAATRAAHAAATALGIPLREGRPSRLPRDDEAVTV